MENNMRAETWQHGLKHQLWYYICLFIYIDRKIACKYVKSLEVFIEFFFTLNVSTVIEWFNSSAAVNVLLFQIYKKYSHFIFCSERAIIPNKHDYYCIILY